MEPTIGPGDLILTLPVAGRRGDVVVFRHASGTRYLKRVAGVGGDEIELEAGRLRVNGRSLDGRPRVPGTVVARWTVPAGHVFVVGDNAHASDDSRTWDQPFVPTRTTRRALRVLPHRPAGAATTSCWTPGSAWLPRGSCGGERRALDEVRESGTRASGTLTSHLTR